MLISDLTPEPTPELLAAARRVATGEWTVEHDEDAFGGAEPALRVLLTANLVELYLPPTRLRLDYWTLNTRGREWLASAEKLAELAAHEDAR